MKMKQENFETDCLTDERIPQKCYRDEESWESYIEGLKQYFVLQGTSAGHRKFKLYSATANFAK